MATARRFDTLARGGGIARSFRVASVLAVAVATAACGALGNSGTFVVEQPRPIGPLPIVLTDSTGKLLSLSPGQQVEGREKFGIDRADGLLPTVEVWWVGLACDERVSMTLDQRRERLRLEVLVTNSRICDLVPVSRSVVLTFFDPIRAEDFDVIVPAGVGGVRRNALPALPPIDHGGPQ
ncbi:MAG TPA: hypothetical protein VNL94_05480 [Candidatus Binatia bacterium]|nr:hypothetical protein [Candidatus Binatia bacterium]